MANALYPKYRESALSQNPSVDMDTDNIIVMLVKTAQAFNAAHQFIGDLTAGNIVARSGNLAGRTVASGIFDANDITFTAPAGGNTCLLILAKNTGSDATSPLIGYYDTGTGLPVVTSGGDVVVAWDNGANKIFAI